MTRYRTEPCSVCDGPVLVDGTINYGGVSHTHFACRRDRTEVATYVAAKGDPMIALSVLRELPVRSTILGVFDDVPDMYGRKSTAIRVIWKHADKPRDGYFDLSSGKYLCEHVGVWE